MCLLQLDTERFLFFSFLGRSSFYSRLSDKNVTMSGPHTIHIYVPSTFLKKRQTRTFINYIRPSPNPGKKRSAFTNA